MIPFASLAAVVAVAAAAAAAPLQLQTRILAERPGAAGTAPVLAPARRMLPGDPLVVELAYRNTGGAAITGLVLANPIPRGLAYRDGQPDMPVPDLSVDGSRFGPLAVLTVALPGGGTRPATAADVTHVRWRLPAALAAGGSGRLAFRAVVR